MSIHQVRDVTANSENIVPDPMQDAVVIEGVSKIFKKERPLLRWPGKKRDEKDEKEVRAVDNVTLTIKRREIVGILGANGSGKSTLIRILSTLLSLDTGSVRIFGYDVVKDERMTWTKPRHSVIALPSSSRDASLPSVRRKNLGALWLNLWDAMSL